MSTDEKASPINLKTVSSTIAGFAAAMGGFWAIDSHYASAADIDKVQRTLEIQVQTTQRSLETQVRSLKVERTEDELFKLDMKKQTQKGRLSPEDEALYQRYLRKLNDASKEQRISDAAATLPNKK